MPVHQEPRAPHGSATADDGPRAGLPGLRETALVALLALALALAFTWPLARHFATDIPYADQPAPGYERVTLAQGDHLQIYYLLWLLQDSVREGRAPLFDPYQFRYGGYRAFFFQPSLLALLALLLAPLGAVAAFNTLILLSFVVAGCATYALLRLGTADRFAALAGALVVALFPYRVGQLAGHVNGMLTALVPLFLLCVECALQRRRWGGWAAGAIAAFFFAGTMEFHIAYHLSLLFAFYLPLRLLFPLAGWFEPVAAAPAANRRVPGALLAAAGGLGAGVALYGAMDRAHALGEPTGWILTPTLAALAAWALWRRLGRELDAVLPAPAAPAGLARALAPFALLGLYPLVPVVGVPHAGKALLVLATVASALAARPLATSLGTLRLRADGAERLRRLAAPVAVLLAGAAATVGFLALTRRLIFRGSIASHGRAFGEVLAFSPRPEDLVRRSATGGEYLVYLGVVALTLALVGLLARRHGGEGAPSRADGFHGVAAALAVLLAVGPHLPQLPLYHLFYDVVPLFNSPRVSGRILAVGVVPFAVTAAAGLEILRRHVRYGGALAGVVLLALVADYLPRHAPGLTTLPREQPAYDRLARERAPGEVALALPLWPGDSAWSSVYFYWTTRYRIPFVNGYSPAVPRDYLDRVFWPLSPLNFGEMGQPERDLARRLGVRHILLHEDVYPAKVSPFPADLAAARLARSRYLEELIYASPVHLYRLREEPLPDQAPLPTSPVGVLVEGENRPGAEVVVDPLASGGAAGQIPAGAPGHAARWIPRRALPAGDYRVTARFFLPAPAPAPGITLRVLDAASGEALPAAGATTVRGDGRVLDVEAGVTLGHVTPIAFEIASERAVDLDFISIRFAERSEPELRFEVEQIAHIGKPVADPQASGGRAVAMAPGYHPRDRAFAGPDRVLPAGRWIATLFMRAAGPGAGERFSVGISNQSAPLASVALPSGGTGQGFTRLDLPFVLERSAPVAFGVNFEGGRELIFDRIEIAAAP
ncbi:MAG TPA: hypothetical protein VI078_00025 [bacterium]